MKVLFIVQGEGRGHLTQAITLEEALRREGHEVVEVMVGKSSNRQLPMFFRRAMRAPITQFESPNFLPTPQNKRNNIPRSVIYNTTRLHHYAASIRLLKRRITEGDVDVVVNFYELLTGLTYLIYNISVPQVSIGHQYMFLRDDFRFPDVNRVELASLRLFTYLTSIGSRQRLALSFREAADDASHRVRVVPPLLRRAVMEVKEHEDSGYVLGYMVNAGFGESIMEWHKAHPDVPLTVFWDKKGASETHHVDSTLSFHQLDDRKFIEAMAHCRAYATTAGFESVCESMYLGKPIMMVPAHVEQDCNAYDAALCGAGIIAHDFDISALLTFAATYEPNEAFRQWVECAHSRITASIEAAAEYPYPHLYDGLKLRYNAVKARYHNLFS